jgi:hypothetical protein
MSRDRHGLVKCADKRRLSWHGAIFNNLLTIHTAATPVERSILEPIIYSKFINYRRDIKQHKICAADKVRTDALLADYHLRITPPLKRSKTRKG